MGGGEKSVWAEMAEMVFGSTEMVFGAEHRLAVRTFARTRLLRLDRCGGRGGRA